MTPSGSSLTMSASINILNHTTYYMLHTTNQKGFTLIEMLFYVLFILFIMGSTFGIIRQLLMNSESLKTGVSVEEEGNFILKKISWVINDSNIVTPAAGSTGSYLYVSKNGGGNVIIDESGGIITINGKQLSNDRFVVKNLIFNRQGTDLLKSSFSIGSRSFELTRQLR